jgi:hypothetical protein
MCQTQLLVLLQETLCFRSREGLGLWPEASFRGANSLELRDVFKKVNHVTWRIKSRLPG